MKEQQLSPEHQAAGLYLEEDDHTLCLKKEDKVLARWSATGATRESICDELQNVNPSNPKGGLS
ncbi:unnamed protein product [marine sediment metagenome]|uniref:Uncharacterized protein n=1 Tax=marine sediment metagenome TaxID=412755 RepID=X1VTJ9_9ZZZZ